MDFEILLSICPSASRGLSLPLSLLLVLGALARRRGLESLIRISERMAGTEGPPRSLDERAEPSPEDISAYDAEQYMAGNSRFKAMSGLKTHSQVRDWARMTPFSLQNNMLNRKIGPGRMPMRDDGKVYVRAQ